MHVGVLELRLYVAGSLSLKDKRRAVKSVKERLRNRFNVSAAEVDGLDHHRVATLGVAFVGNDGKFVQQTLSNVVAYVRRDTRVQLLGHTVEIT